MGVEEEWESGREAPGRAGEVPPRRPEDAPVLVPRRTDAGSSSLSDRHSQPTKTCPVRTCVSAGQASRRLLGTAHSGAGLGDCLDHTEAGRGFLSLGSWRRPARLPANPGSGPSRRRSLLGRGCHGFRMARAPAVSVSGKSHQSRRDLASCQHDPAARAASPRSVLCPRVLPLAPVWMGERSVGGVKRGNAKGK